MDFDQLWTSQLTDLRFEDLTAFCAAGHQEHVKLDYKERVETTKVPQIVASFANTHGGIILYGVPEASDGIPGQIGDGLPETDSARIRDACHQINPPVSPEIQHVRKPDSESGVIVVRVQPSLAVPHMAKGFVYVRVNDSSQPRPPTLDTLRGMLAGRDKSMQVQADRRERMEERFDAESGQRFRVLYRGGPVLDLGDAASVEDLKAMARNCAKPLPILNDILEYRHEPATPVADGVTWRHSDSSAAVDRFGNFTLCTTRLLKVCAVYDERGILESCHHSKHHKQPAGHGTENYRCVQLENICETTRQVLEFARAFWAEVCPTTEVVFGVHVRGTQGLPLVHGSACAVGGCSPLDDTISGTLPFLSTATAEDVLDRIIDRIAWGWGFEGRPRTSDLLKST